MGDVEFDKGLKYDNGDGVEKNHEEAVRWYKEAVALGNIDAMNELGVCFKTGKGVTQNDEEGARLYRLSAENGNSIAMSNLGWCYEYGDGVEKNIQKAVQWYRLSAEQNDEFGQNNLGRCYENGIGVKQNYEEAVRYYRLSADQGFDEAQRALGRCYENGIGVEKNYEEAVWFYLKAGDDAAKYDLSRLFEKGRSFEMEQNYEEALRWFKMAAEHGQRDAQFSLACLHEKGKGVERNYEEAFRWFKLAAEQGLSDAMTRVAYYYKIGQGVEQNEEEAMCWFQKAVDKDKSQKEKDKKLKELDTNIIHGNFETLLNTYQELRKPFKLCGFEKKFDRSVFQEWGKDPALEKFLAQESLLDDLISQISQKTVDTGEVDGDDALNLLAKQRDEAAKSCLESAKQLLARYKIVKHEFEDFSRLRSQVMANFKEENSSSSDAFSSSDALSSTTITSTSQKVDLELFLKRRQDFLTDFETFMGRSKEARAVTDNEAKKSGELLELWSKSVHSSLFNDGSPSSSAYSKMINDFHAALASFQQALVAESDLTVVDRKMLSVSVREINQLIIALFDEHHKAHLKLFVDSVDRAQRRLPELEARSVGPPSLEQLKECRKQEKAARKRYLVAKVVIEPDSDDDEPLVTTAQKERLTKTLKDWRKASRNLERVATDLSLHAASLFPELVYQSKILRDKIGSGIHASRALDHYEHLIELPGRHHVSKVRIGDRICVLKAYPLAKEQNRQAFRKEVKFLSQLSHPHVVELTASFIENNTGYVEMPFYEYGDLWQWKKKVDPDAGLLQLVFRSALLGLSFVHSMDVIHSDVKPGNIFVDSSHCAKLGDFDVSKDDSERVRDLMTTAVLPTAVGFTSSYVAPELLSSVSSAKPSKPSDVYAFGLCLFDVHFSDAPGESKRPSASEVAHGRKDICFPDDANEDLIKTLTALLNKEPNKRPSCSDALLQLSYFSLPKGSSSDTVVQNCLICDKATVNGIKCASDLKHFQCDECLARYFSAFTSADDGVQLLVPDGSGVKCPFPTNKEHDCRPYNDAELAQLLPADVFQQSMEVRARHVEQRLSVHYDLRLQQELREREAQGVVQRHRQYIIERILNLACPRCSAAFFDFTGCFAVSCARCHCNFCGWCFQDCGNDAHSHVVRCPLGNGQFYATFEKFEENNRVRRQQKVRAYLADILEQELRNQVKQACKKEFNDLNLKI